MSAIASDPSTAEPDATTTVAELIRFLETGQAPAGLFAPDCFADVHLPLWRLQADDANGSIRTRLQRHPGSSTVTVLRVDPTPRGFVMEFEERWQHQGQRWYATEMLRADVSGSTIVEFSVFCTGDWDEKRQREHAAAVTLLRP